MKIGDKIKVKAIVIKESGDKGKRFRERIPCNRTGYVTGLRKKMVEWLVTGGGPEYCDGLSMGYSAQNYAVGIKWAYVVEFKESRASKAQEALLEDVERVQDPILCTVCETEIKVLY